MKKWIAGPISSSSRLLPAVCQVLMLGQHWLAICESLPRFFSPEWVELAAQDCAADLRKEQCEVFRDVTYRKTCFVADWCFSPTEDATIDVLSGVATLHLCCSQCRVSTMGRRMVLAVASEQLRHGRCPRLAPQNPYTLSTLINS